MASLVGHCSNQNLGQSVSCRRERKLDSLAQQCGCKQPRVECRRREKYEHQAKAAPLDKRRYLVDLGLGKMEGTEEGQKGRGKREGEQDIDRRRRRSPR